MLDLKSFNKKIGEHFRDIRLVKRMTQEELADQSGLSRDTIASLESGRQAMSMYQLAHMVLGLKLENLDSLYKVLLNVTSVSDMGWISHAKLTKDQQMHAQRLIANFDENLSADV